MDRDILLQTLYATRYNELRNYWCCFNIDMELINNEQKELNGPYIPSYSGEKFYNIEFLMDLISGEYPGYSVKLEFYDFVKVLEFFIFRDGDKLLLDIEIDIFDLEDEPKFKNFLETETDIVTILSDSVSNSKEKLKELNNKKSDIENEIDLEEDFLRVTKKLFPSVALLDELEK